MRKIKKIVTMLLAMALIVGAVGMGSKEMTAKVTQKKPLSVKKTKYTISLGDELWVWDTSYDASIVKAYEHVKKYKGYYTCVRVQNLKIKVLKKSGKNKIKIKKDPYSRGYTVIGIKSGTAKIKVKLSGQLVKDKRVGHDSGTKVTPIWKKKIPAVTKTVTIKVKNCPKPKPNKTSVTINKKGSYEEVEFYCGDADNIKKLTAESEDPSIVKVSYSKKTGEDYRNDYVGFKGYKDGTTNVNVTVYTKYPINGKSKFHYTISVTVNLV